MLRGVSHPGAVRRAAFRSSFMMDEGAEFPVTSDRWPGKKRTLPLVLAKSGAVGTELSEPSCLTV